MKVLLDTHMLLWWYENSTKIPKPYQKILDQKEAREETVGISIISLWEISTLISKNKIEVGLSLDQWFSELEEDPLIDVYPLNAAIILDASRLGSQFPKDPSDQIITATARYHELHLMTVDERIIDSKMVAIA